MCPAESEIPPPPADPAPPQVPPSPQPAETPPPAPVEVLHPGRAGRRSGAARRPVVETKTYGDGTTATGVAPLPERSPDEQASDAAQEHAYEPDPAHISEVTALAGALHSKLQQIGGSASRELGKVKACLEGALHYVEEHLKI